jgi:hypothetical protein
VQRSLLIIGLSTASLLAGGFSDKAAAQCPDGRPVGTIVGTVGTVRVLRSNGADFAPAPNGTVLCQGDRLQSAGDGRARVEWADRAENAGPTVLNLGLDSEIVIVRFEVKPSEGERTGVIELIRGAVRAFTKGWGQGSFSVRTGTSVCGIRGSHVAIGYFPTSPPAARGPAGLSGPAFAAVQEGTCECPPREIDPSSVPLTDGQELEIGADGSRRVVPLSQDRWRQIVEEQTPDPPGLPPLDVPVPDRTPAAPTLTALTNGLELTLTWTAIANALEYWLEVGTAPGLANLYRAFVSGTRLVTPGPAGTFWAQVRSWNTSGYSGPSNSTMFTLGSPTPGPCAPPPTPTGLTQTRAGNLLTLGWLAALGATSYQLQAGTARGLSNVFDGDVGGGVSVSFDVGGVPAAVYFARVLAKSLCGTSAATPDLEVDLRPAAPSPPPPGPAPPGPGPGPGAGYGVVTNAALPGFNTALHGNNLTPEQCQTLCDQHDGTGGTFLCRSFDFQKGPLDAQGRRPGWCFLSSGSHQNAALRRNDPDWDYYWNRARVPVAPPP